MGYSAGDSILTSKVLFSGSKSDIVSSLSLYEEVYILPETIVKIEDPNKELYLRAKKIKRYSKNSLILTKDVQATPEHNQEQKEKIWILIADSEEGLELDEIIEKTKLDKATVESIIHDLLNDGDIYEPSALKFKKI